jgi:hypothetical protein
MSNRNGDKSRHHRMRKQKIQRRAAFAALVRQAESAPKSTAQAGRTAKPAKSEAK